MHEPPSIGPEAGSSTPTLAVRSPENSRVETNTTHEADEIKRSLVLNAARQRQWEDYVVENMALKADMPREVASELLKLHWCWIHPMFMFVYRPAFTSRFRLSASGGLTTDITGKEHVNGECRVSKSAILFKYAFESDLRA